MKTGFVTIRSSMSDLDPQPPQPVPFPVRIIRDPHPPPSPVDILDLPPPNRLGRKTDYFYQAWDRFLAVQPKRAKRVSRAARKVAERKAEVAAGPSSEGLKVEENAATSWEQATAECRAKVAAIVEECKRLNQKYRDACFNPESSQYCFQSLGGGFPGAVDNVDAPPWIKRVEDIFDNPQFFIDGATASDVHQGNGGDCWFLAALMAISAKKELIENVCVARDEKVGVYGFVFFRDGEWIYEVIDDKLYMRVGDDDDLNVVRDWDRDKKEGTSLHHDADKLKNTLQRGGEALYFSHCKSDETWLPLIEKAYAKAHGDYCSIEGGSASEGIEDLTGGVATVINPEDIMDKDRFWKEQLSQVNEKYLFGGGTRAVPSRGFVGGHAYTVLRIYEEGDLRLLKLRNPWGQTEWEGDWGDGSKMWTPQLMMKLDHTFGDDGIFWISYKDFIKEFPHINRVRLFNKDWKVAQQWTCVEVPWTVDYLDTKFEITVTERGPLVVVLSQPDNRYFYGLAGRYFYSLHFRVYKEGSDTYLFRSMHNSGNGGVHTRSVSAELDDVEPGKYSVIFKVTAVRIGTTTSAGAIENYAVDRKEKLLDVGRKFDYAQSKGNLRAFQKNHEHQRKLDDREQAKELSKRSREVKMKNRAKEKLRKKRITDALNEEKKILLEKERERRKERKAKVARKKKEEKQEQTAFDIEVEERRRATQENVRSMVENDHSGRNQKDDSRISAGANESGSEKGNITPDSGVGTTENIEMAKATALEPTQTSQQSESQDNEQTSETTADEVLQVSDPSSAIAPLPDLVVPANTPQPPIEVITQGLVEISIDDCTTIRHRHPPLDPFASVTNYDSDSELDLPPSPIYSLHDDDFPWDSEFDGRAYLSTSDSSSGGSDDDKPTARSKNRTSSAAQLDFFANDPWNAMVVLGLRVYSKGEVKVTVVRDEDEDEDE